MISNNYLDNGLYDADYLYENMLNPNQNSEEIIYVWVLSSPDPQPPNVVGIWNDNALWNDDNIWYD